MKLALLLLVIFMSCGKETTTTKSSFVKQTVSPIYNSSKLNIKVYYEEGAEPYTDQILSLDLWSLFQQNIEALLEGRSIQVQVPKTLAEMIKLTKQNKSTWTPDDILDLSKQYAVPEEAGTTTFQIFFVAGVSKENAGIIGFHISGTKIMAIFKDVVKSSSNGQLGFVPRYVEQATVIHEMGHALGLVNNGVPMKVAHQDKTNGAHCSNPKCVMYYQNEGAADLINFAKDSHGNGSTVMFDQQCLDDAKNYQK